MNSTFVKKYGPWAVVTGASDGIGRAIAEELARRGLNVFLVSRNQSRLAELCTHLSSSYGVDAKHLSVDLSLPGSGQTLFLETSGYDVGLFCAVAGFGTSGPFKESNIDEELNMVDLNCRAVVEQTHFYVNKMSLRKSGGIVLISSLVAFQGVPRASTYSASKSFVLNFGEALYFELRPLGIDVLVTAPGPVASGFAARARMQMGQAANPRAVALATLNQLGHSSIVRPGWLAKLLELSLWPLSRHFRSMVMAKVMLGMIKT